MEQIFKILEMFMGLSVAKSQASTKQIITAARRLVIIALISLGAMALFCVGIAMIVIDLAHEIDHPVLVGSVLAVISLIAMLVGLRQKAWVKASAPKEEDESPRVASPVEQALAMLIMDIVSERQAKRSSPMENDGPRV